MHINIKIQLLFKIKLYLFKMYCYLLCLHGKCSVVANIWNPKDKIRTALIESFFITVLCFMNHMPVNRNKKKTIVKNKEAFQSAVVTYVRSFPMFPRKPVFFFFFFFEMDLIGILLMLKLPLKKKKKLTNK